MTSSGARRRAPRGEPRAALPWSAGRWSTGLGDRRSFVPREWARFGIRRRDPLAPCRAVLGVRCCWSRSPPLAHTLFGNSSLATISANAPCG